MSTTIDNRVVEMRFDNQHFEKNVATSMSTLDKLKQKLNLTGAAKGLDSVNSSAKKVDMTGLANGVETVRSRFSALEVMGVTALANITNSAVNAGKRMVSALTIDPIKTGFSEYETKINAVQTIMSNTASKGTTMADVTRVLDELNTYADKTIYNFAEMTRNIGTFTAAGVGLEESASAIQGIANLAAASGSNSQQASTAMYQLSQALAAGTVKLMDWNSVVNAGMGGEKFQEALKATARDHGVAVDEIIKKNGSFRESLQEGWITADVLNETLSKFTEEGAAEYAKSMMESGKWTQKQADALMAEAKSMTDAATKVKTFTQLIDTLKESMQSGWAKTWELLFGDFEEAREFFSGISDKLGGVIGEISDARNNLLEGALGSKWDKFSKQIEKAGIPLDKFQSKLKETAKENGVDLDKLIKKYGSLEKAIQSGKISADLIIKTLKKFAGLEKDTGKSTEDMTEKLKYFQKVVDQVWHGDFKNGQARVEALTKAGYNYAEVQDLVNKTVDGHKLKLEDLSDAQLKSVGYTDKEIDKFRELAAQAEKTGTPLNKLINDLEKPSGRTLFIDSISNVIEAIGKPLGAIREAWRATFGEMITSDSLYKVIEGINAFTESLIMSDDAAENFKKICEGIFSIFQLMTGVITRSLTVGLKIAGAVLQLFGTNLLEVGAAIADYIIKFRDWVQENTIFIGSIDKIANILKIVIDGIKNCVNAFLELEAVQKIVKKIVDTVAGWFDGLGGTFEGFNLDTFTKSLEKAFEQLETWIKSLKDTKDLGKAIVDGLAEGIQSRIGWAIDAIINLGQNIIDAFCKLLGIHSPSTVFIKLGSFIISGLLIGLTGSFPKIYQSLKDFTVNMVDIIGNVVKDGVPFIADFVKNAGVKVSEAFQAWDIDFGSLVVVGTIIGIFVILNKLTKILDKVTNPLEKLGGLFDTVKDSIDSFAKAKAFNAKTDGILNIAKAIGILAGSFYLLSRLKWSEIGKGAVAIGAISVALLGLSFVASKMDPIEIGKLSGFLLSFSIAIVILSGAMKILSGIYIEDAISAIASMAVMITGMAGLLYVFGKFVDNEETAKQMHKAGKLFRKMAVAMIIMAAAIKIAASISKEDLGRGTAVIGGIALMFGMFITLASTAKHADKAGSLMLKMAIALAILPIVIRMIARIDNGDIIKGLTVIASIELLFAGIVLVSKYAGEHASKAGGMLLKMSIAIGILATTMKLIATMSYDDIQKGLVCIAGVEALFAAFILVSKLAKNDGNKAGSMIFKMAAGMAMMAVAIKLIATMSVGDIVKGLAVISAIEVLFGAMVVLSKLSGGNADKAGSMMLKMSAAILVLVGAIAILSLLDPKDVAVGTAAITALLLSFAAIAYAASMIDDCMKTLIVIAATIALLVGAVVGLTFIDPQKVATASASISAILGMLALLVASTKYAGKVDKSLAIIVGVVAALGGILYLLSGLPVESTLATATSLSLLLMSIAAALKIISTVSKVSKSALVGVFALSGVIAILAGILGTLAYLKLEPSIETATSLSVLLIAMTGALKILSTITRVSASAIGAMYMLSGVVALVAGILGVLAYLDVTPSIETATSLSILLLAMAGVTAILSAIGPMAAGAIAGAGAFVAVVGIIGALLVALGALVKYIPSVEDFLDRGIGVLEKIGYGIGSFVGNVVAGISDGALAGLPAIGTHLSNFMTNAQPFIDGVKTVDDTALKGIGILVAAIGALVASNLVENVTSFMQFGSSFSSLGTELSNFIKNAKPFIDGVKSFTPEMFEGVRSLTKAILEITAASFIEGITRFLPISSSLSQFGSQLPQLGTSLRGFVTNLGTFTEDQVTSVKCAGNAIKALADASKNIDGQAEWTKKLFGDNGLGAFSGELPKTATALRTFVTNLGTFSEDQVATVKCAGDAIKALAKAGSEVDGQADWSKKLFGDNSLAAFAGELPKTATALKGFVTNLGTFSEDQVNSAKCAGNVIKALAKAGSNIDGQAGWAKKLFGDDGLGAFSGELPKTAKNLKAFVANLGTFGDDKIATVNSAVGVVKAMAKLGGTNLKGMVSNLPSLGDKMIEFGDDLVTFCDKVGGLDSSTIADTTSGILSAVKGLSGKIKSNTKSLKNAGADLGQAVANGIKSKKTAVNSAAKELVGGAKKGINSTKKSFETAGKNLGTALSKGIKAKDDSVKTAVKSLCKAGETAASNYKDEFESAGKDLGNGLVNGIEAKYTAAYNAGYTLGQKAAQGEKDGQQSNSPSKLTYKAGIWLGEGLVNGMAAMGKKVYRAGHNMGDSVTTSMSDAIRKISNVIDSDMDVQPTIRPVLDLSDVKSTAGTISGMFNDATVGVAANANVISSMMNQRNQNGTNDDIINAIDKLRKGISNVGGDTYVVEGVTYDDGSNITSAVKEIVRAAKVERRA